MIRVSNVTHHYGIRPVLKNLSMEVKTGDLVTVLGPNGMGKTTLLGVIAGALCPVAGEVEIDAPMLLVGPLAIALAVFITLAAPPTLEQWHFTGHYRLSDKLTRHRGQFEQL